MGVGQPTRQIPIDIDTLKKHQKANGKMRHCETPPLAKKRWWSICPVLRSSPRELNKVPKVQGHPNPSRSQSVLPKTHWSYKWHQPLLG